MVDALTLLRCLGSTTSTQIRGCPLLQRAGRCFLKSFPRCELQSLSALTIRSGASARAPLHFLAYYPYLDYRAL
ncbi:hypothetical protein Cob_v007384 [Colletotrichum orbiculare MAFF 240422]|uniref:Uncharacterized protein n=1 Tax=Colletotrichum orbiculare (strain 104-T / ATCC 96160 / CBS 514.97 / LARS 414 / MAFF 240422) TaxID=1213857 RepID=A0A484FN80_COLOR|nr:hypothetical protein Cob_v007384 [Colletotrichum orbiculare MAFF 240422]